jgi:serine/threonine protein phosphatase 1
MTRILAIGDIHGCHRSFDSLLSLVQPKRDDLLVTLGDYVDRGPRSSQVLDMLIDLERSHQLIPLRGNHETMMMAARNGMVDARRWMLSGGSETLDSYKGRNGKIAQLEDIPKKHWDFLCQRLRPYFETSDYIFVHGTLDPQLSMEKQTTTLLEWTGFSSLNSKHLSGKVVICGHETQDDGIPRYNDFGVCIDTGAWNDGWLTCYDPQLGYIWQTNERGESRQSSLPCQYKPEQSHAPKPPPVRS